MQLLTQILKQINDYVWGLPLICLLLVTGNSVGVATAIATGGPGALFWMWI